MNAPLSKNWEAEMLHESVALDFVNTVSERPSDAPVERIGTPAALVRWGMLAGLLSGAEAKALEKQSAGARAEKAVAEAIRLRDALYRTFTAVAYEKTPAPADLELVTALAAEASARRHLVAKRGAPAQWSWQPIEELRDLTLRAAWDAAEVLTQKQPDRLRLCGECLWVFYDGSKNGSRRWCNMSACGNRAKARRHYARVRDA